MLFLFWLFLAPDVTFCLVNRTLLLNLLNKMATTSSTCYLRGSSFEWLGCHLPQCKQRDGKDYEHLLSAKTKGLNQRRKFVLFVTQFFFTWTHIWGLLDYARLISTEDQQTITSAMILWSYLHLMKNNVRAIADSVVPAVLAASNLDDKNVRKFKLVCLHIKEDPSEVLKV